MATVGSKVGRDTLVQESSGGVRKSHDVTGAQRERRRGEAGSAVYTALLQKGDRMRIIEGVNSLIEIRKRS